ncbi:Phosphotransferase enzyme family protein [Sinosporangium album]|uniref:Phosphotransferase enzyme family protein n=1 Tax=Sinosporangium album TaxID=504805 RepID=A0A1G7T407_9ACTN|nr:aminoglycoside phosphotransferase family protein [Sinosporangium album]SDG29822.1 Phosphotransferase enzyme family protein [Sinosporangium album]
MTEGVVRVGATVRRPARASTGAVHALLRHLAAEGFTQAPRVLGVDELGREVLTYVEGETVSRPLRPHVVGEESLAALAELLRRLHDATEGFVPPRDAVWEKGSNDDADPEVIGHCDITPENVIFRDWLPYALIDFDLARPTTRLFDVVTTLRHWAPLADPVDRDPLQRSLDVPARVRLFCDAYGMSPRDRRRLTEVARLRFTRAYASMRERAETHGGGWARMWAQGAGERLRRASAWLDEHEETLHAHLV